MRPKSPVTKSQLPLIHSYSYLNTILYEKYSETFLQNQSYGPVTMATSGISSDIFRPQHHHKQHHHSLCYHYLWLLQNGTPLKMRQPAHSSAVPPITCPAELCLRLCWRDHRKWFPRGAAVPTQHSKDIHTLKNGGETFSGIAHNHFIRRGENTHARKIVSIRVLRNTEKDISLSVMMPIIWHSNATSAIQLLVSHKRWVKTLMSFVKREKEVENPSHKDPLWLKIQGKQY